MMVLIRRKMTGYHAYCSIVWLDHIYIWTIFWKRYRFPDVDCKTLARLHSNAVALNSLYCHGRSLADAGISVFQQLCMSALLFVIVTQVFFFPHKQRREFSKTFHFETWIPKVLVSEKTIAVVMYTNSQNTTELFLFHLKTALCKQGLHLRPPPLFNVVGDFM